MSAPADRPLAGALLGALAACLPFAAATVVFPFGRDQGIYAYTAARVLEGDALYAQIYAFKPPMTVAVHAAALLAFGHSMLSIRLFDLGWTLATAAVLFLLATRAFGDRLWGALAALLFCYNYGHLTWWNTAQTDGWASLPLAIAFTAVLPPAESADRDRPAAHFAAGLALAAAAFFKYTLAIYAPFVAALPLLLRGRRAARDLSALVVGGLVGVGLVVAGLAATGALTEFIATQREVTLPYTQMSHKTDGDLAARLDLVGKRLAWLGLPTLIIAGLGVPWAGHQAWTSRDPSRRFALVGVVLWAFSAAASTWVQGKFFAYHFLPLLAPTSLLAAGVVAPIVAWFAARRPGWPVAPVLFGLTAWGLLWTDPFPERLKLLGERVAGRIDSEQMWRQQRLGYRDMDLNNCLTVAEWIAAHSAPDDRVFLWSYDPLIYFQADRRLVSRFPYTYPLVVPWAPPTFRDELITALRADPPAIIGVGSRDATPFVTQIPDDSYQSLQKFPKLKAFVKDHYTEAAKVGTYRLYLRADRAASAAPLQGAPPEVP